MMGGGHNDMQKVDWAACPVADRHESLAAHPAPTQHWKTCCSWTAQAVVHAGATLLPIQGRATAGCRWQAHLAWWDVQPDQLALAWPVDLCIGEGLDALVTRELLQLLDAHLCTRSTAQHTQHTRHQSA